MNVKNNNEGCSVTLCWAHMIIGTLTAMIGYHIHSSIFWAVMDFFFFPLAWIKWLVMHQVNLSIIKETFSFFLK